MELKHLLTWLLSQFTLSHFSIKSKLIAIFLASKILTIWFWMVVGVFSALIRNGGTQSSDIGKRCNNSKNIIFLSIIKKNAVWNDCHSWLILNSTGCQKKTELKPLFFAGKVDALFPSKEVVNGQGSKQVSPCDRTYPGCVWTNSVSIDGRFKWAVSWCWTKEGRKATELASCEFCSHIWALVQLGKGMENNN